MRAFLLSALVLSAWPSCAAEMSARETANAFYCAVERDDYDAVLDLRSEVAPLPANGFTTLLNGLRTIDSGDVLLATVAESANAADFLALVPVYRDGRFEVLRERNIRLVVENGRWRVARECSVERDRVEALVAAPDLHSLPVDDLTDDLETELILYCNERIALRSEDKARIAMDLVEQLGTMLGDPKVKGRVIGLRARTAFFNAKYAAALELYQTSHALSQREGDIAFDALLLTDMCFIHQRQLRFEVAIDDARQALALAGGIGDEYAMASAYGNLATAERFEGDYDEAAADALRAIALHRRLGRYFGEATTLANLGVLYADQGRVANALTYHLKAERANRRLGNRWGEATAIENTGILHSNFGDSRVALELLGRAYETFCQLNDKVSMAWTQRTMSSALDELGQPRESLRVAIEALRLTEGVGSEDLTRGLLHRLGMHFQKVKRYEDARRYFFEELWMTEVSGSRSLESVALGEIAGTYAAEKKYGEAARFAQRASDAARDVRLPDAYSHAKVAAARAAIHAGRLADAERAYGSAIAAIEQIRANMLAGQREQRHFMDERAEPYRELARLLAAEGTRQRRSRLPNRGRAASSSMCCEAGTRRSPRDCRPRSRPRSRNGPGRWRRRTRASPARGRRRASHRSPTRWRRRAVRTRRSSPASSSSIRRCASTAAR